MTPTNSAIGLANMLLHARNAVSDRVHASHQRIERLCMALSAAQDKLLSGRLSEADRNILNKALDEWENEGGR